MDREVYAETAIRHAGGLVEDTALLMLAFDGGLRASLDPSWSRPAAYAEHGDLAIEITGTADVAQVDASSQYVEVLSSQTHAARHDWGDDLARLTLAGWLGQCVPVARPQLAQPTACARSSWCRRLIARPSCTRQWSCDGRA